MAARERFLVTGSAGCIGSWVMHLLSEEGTETVGLDLSSDHRRLRLLTDRQGSMRFVQGDIADTEFVLGVVAGEGITHIVHLAALQIPFCQADPVGGAQVNVVGTVNVLEAARRSAVAGLAYASSVAVYGPPDLYPGGVTDDSPLAPTTLYGVYKQANERSARVYAADHGVSSVCLRPCSVYGPGRDQGLTSAPTQAMVAAAAGEPYRIPFGGGSTFQHAGEVARLFIAAARAEAEGAHVYNLGGPSASIAEVVSLISAQAPGSEITYGGPPLPLPDQYDGAGLDRLLGGVEYLSMEEGVATSIGKFRELLDRGLIEPPDSSRRAPRRTPAD